MESVKPQPEKKFRAGAVSATVWMNATEKGTFPSVQLSKSYRDKDNNWKESNSFSKNDIPNVQLVMAESFRYLQLREGRREEMVAVH